MKSKARNINVAIALSGIAAGIALLVINFKIHAVYEYKFGYYLVYHERDAFHERNYADWLWNHHMYAYLAQKATYAGACIATGITAIVLCFPCGKTKK